MSLTGLVHLLDGVDLRVGVATEDLNQTLLVSSNTLHCSEEGRGGEGRGGEGRGGEGRGGEGRGGRERKGRRSEREGKEEGREAASWRDPSPT